MDFFDSTKPWYKGNLHTHTTRSDGRLSVEDCIARYKAEGYDFLALTDHNLYGPAMEWEDFVVLAGTEFNREFYDRGTAYHILSIGHDCHFERAETPQQIIHDIRAHGGWVVMAHPAWSLMSAQEIDELEGIDAIECYNGISDAYSSRGDSTSIMDVLATMGKPFPMIAVDDMHFNGRDFARGFIRVQAEALTARSILDAIRAGKFYSSQGPEIRQLSFDGQTLTIQTSPVRRISFMTDTWYVKDRVRLAENGQLLTGAQYTVTPKDRWLRVEAEDDQGRLCWSNYIPLDKQ